MIRVVIAEDKHPILRNIISKIERHSPEIKVVGAEADGISALQKILMLKPDIVFTDIRMPGMDGLQLITEAKQAFPDIVFVIISGYDEFEYARSAMKLGVTEYLLKPVTQQSIDDTLLKIVDSIKARKTDFENKIWNEVLNSHTPQPGIEAPDLGYDSYLALLVCAGSYSNFDTFISNPAGDFFAKIDLKLILSRYICKHANCWIVDGQEINEQNIILGFHQNVSIDPQAIAQSIICNLSRYKIPVTVVVGKKTAKVHDIRHEYKFMKALLKKFLVFGRPGIILSDEANLNSSVDSYLMNSFNEQKLVTFIKANNRKCFFQELVNTMSVWETKNYTQNVIEKCLKQLAALCGKNTSVHQQTHSDLDLEIAEVLSMSTNYNLLVQGIFPIFGRYFNEKGETRLSQDSSTGAMEKVDTYIKEHFTESISINDIADMVNLNVSYLSREFKKYKGVAPIEYLTQLRIDKAKELMSNTSEIKFKEIAEIVGYSNQYYFSKVFKLITGLSPSEYKESLQPQ